MADIQQAAKWMMEGKKVRRARWAEVPCFLQSTRYGFLEDYRREPPNWLMIDDVLADDWEIFEWVN